MPGREKEAKTQAKVTGQEIGSKFDSSVSDLACYTMSKNATTTATAAL